VCSRRPSPAAAAADARAGYRSRSAATTAPAIAAAIAGGVADLSPGRIRLGLTFGFSWVTFRAWFIVRLCALVSGTQSEDFKKSRVFRSTPTGMVRVEQLRRSAVRQQAKKLGKTMLLLDATGLPSNLSAHTNFG